MNAIVCKIHLIFYFFRQPCIIHTLLNNILLKYLFFLIGGVARNLDSLKSIKKGRENSFEGVSCTDE